MGISILTDGHKAVLYCNTDMLPMRGYPVVDDKDFFASPEDAANDLLAWCPMVLGGVDPRHATDEQRDKIVTDWEKIVEARREQFGEAGTDQDNTFMEAMREGVAASR